MKNINAVKYNPETMIDYADAWNYAHSRRGEVNSEKCIKISTDICEIEGIVPYAYTNYIIGNCQYENIVLDSFFACDATTAKNIEKAKKYNLPLNRVYKHVFNREQFFALFKDYPKKG